MVAGALQAQPQAPFAAGTAAFEQGDYPRALRLFEQARAQGADSAALRYNIGVCQYRVGDFAQADVTFGELAARYPEFAALADYNRGLALLALQRRDDAVVAFTRARDKGDERLMALAQSALDELGFNNVTPAARRWSGYFSAAAGHDDNVALIDELGLPANIKAASPLTEFVGYARREAMGRVPVRIDFSGYVVRYADSAVFDQNAFRVDASFLWKAGDDWQLEAGPYLSSSTLDGDGFERALGAQVRAFRNIGSRLMFDARFIYDDIDSPTARFDFVSGHRERLRLGLEHSNADTRLRVSYEHESQNRADPGVSPDRDRLAFSASRRVGGRWAVDGLLAYRSSRYGALAVPRRERLLEFAAEARRELRAGWLLNIDYRLADDSSNVALFGYTSHRVTAGVSRTF
jgi:hypothetical protein